MKLLKSALALGIGFVIALPAATASAGFAPTSMVITIEETTVEANADAFVNVALQTASVGSCEMEGDLELIVDGAMFLTVELLDTTSASVNEHDFVLQFATLGDHTINANFTPRDIALPNVSRCFAPGPQLDQIITVVPATTTTSTEQEEDEESTTTSEEIPESVEDSVTATLAKAGASNGNSLAVAAVILIIAGAGFALIRRRT